MACPFGTPLIQEHNPGFEVSAKVSLAQLAERALAMRIFLRVGARLIIRLASGAHHASEDAVREDVALLSERLDQIDAWIEEGRLNAPELNAADFQIAANVAALLKWRTLHH